MNDSRSVKCGLATLMFVYYTQVDNERIFVQFSISFANAAQIYVVRDFIVPIRRVWVLPVNYGNECHR